jgi:hypothetical protein
MEELVADAPVEPDAPGNVLDVRLDRFAEIGDLLDKGDLRREERIGGILTSSAVDYRGLNGLPSGARLVFRVEFFFAGGTGPVFNQADVAPRIALGFEVDSVGRRRR